MMSTKINLIRLFWIFFKISCVLFGGGYAILPFLKSEMAEKEKICTIEEIADYYALSQCFPGLVAGNISVLIGYKARGFWGALVCIIGVCLPAYLSIVLIFSFLMIIMGHPVTQVVFQVLDIAICVLIFLTVAELWQRSLTDKFTTSVFVIALVTSVLNVSPFIIVIFAAIMGVMKYFLSVRFNGTGGCGA